MLQQRAKRLGVHHVTQQHPKPPKPSLCKIQVPPTYPFFSILMLNGQHPFILVNEGIYGLVRSGVASGELRLVSEALAELSSPTGLLNLREHRSGTGLVG